MDPFQAAREDNDEQLASILTPETIDESDGTGLTALHWACVCDSVRCVSWLVNARADVNATDMNGSTPLHVASSHDSVRCAHLMIRAGANVLALDVEGWTPLHAAAVVGRCDALGLLLEVTPDGVTQKDTEGSTALHLAAQCGSLACCELLVTAGSELDALDEEECTPLWNALDSCFDDVAEYLIDQGARLEKIRVAPNIPPPWAEDMFLGRQACRSSALAFAGLRRRSRVIGGNGRDVLQLIARLIWESRRSEQWNPTKRRGSLYG
jgi:ankyrin repeat protein